jgi:hypothetical protein
LGTVRLGHACSLLLLGILLLRLCRTHCFLLHTLVLHVLLLRLLAWNHMLLRGGSCPCCCPCRHPCCRHSCFCYFVLVCSVSNRLFWLIRRQGVLLLQRRLPLV